MAKVSDSGFDLGQKKKDRVKLYLTANTNDFFLYIHIYAHNKLNVPCVSGSETEKVKLIPHKTALSNSATATHKKVMARDPA